MHPRGFGFLTFEEGSAFVTPPDLNAFLDGDLVSAELSPAGAGRFNATGLKLEERWRTELFGTVTYRGRKPFLRVDRLVANTDWPLEADYPEGTPLIAEIVKNKAVGQRVVEGDLGLARCVVRHGIRSVFPDEVLEEARKRIDHDADFQRNDLREVTTVTIDAPTTTDIDDALSALPPEKDGSLRILVSIADVDAYVKPGTPLDSEARRRGTSVYLAGHVLPMLPDELSSGAVSLLPNEDRMALTVEMRISPEGDLTSIDVYESWIRSHARLSYDAVTDYLLNPQPDDDEIGETLKRLRAAAARLSTVRAARGGVELAREEAYVSFDPATREVSSLEPRGETLAHRIVERLMVAANEAIARWLVDRGQPGMFRVHEEPDKEQVEKLAESARHFGLEPAFGGRLTPRRLAAFEAQFRGTLVAPALRTVLGWALGPARYTVHPGPHFGLGAPLYLHFTSPIRRYADLVVHRLVKGYLRGDRSMQAGDPALEETAAKLTELTLRASKAETERHRMLVARYFAARVGEEVRGNIVAIKPFGLVLQMIGTGATGVIPLEEGHAYRIGDPVEAKVVGADEELGRVELSIL